MTKMDLQESYRSAVKGMDQIGWFNQDFTGYVYYTALPPECDLVQNRES